MDYSVRDSSVYQDPDAYKEYDRSDGAIRLGIVRQVEETIEGHTRYVVEVFMGGNQVPVSCVLMTRWGGPYNFEEYRLKPWLQVNTGGLLPPTTASTYELRNGDAVVVAFLDGKAREGIILGGIRHPSREEMTEGGELSYISTFNGLETKIDADGAYTVTFNGAPINDQAPSPPGAPVTPVQYNPLVAGSTYGFDSSGSFKVDVSSQAADTFIEMTKDAASPSITIVSGKNSITLAGNPALGEMTIVTDTLAFEALSTSFSSTQEFKVETLQMSLKGTQVAIGNDTFELFDGLIQLIDALGSLVVTSPVGTCTPLQAAPTWAAQVLPLKIKLQTVKGSL